jgi:hypothetical protein
MRSKILLLIVLTACGLLALNSTVTAALMVADSHSFTVDPADTKWTESLDVPQYNPADHGGAALEQVRLNVAMTATGDVTFNGNGTTVDAADAGGMLSVAGPGGIDEALDPTDQIAPPEIQLAENQPVQVSFSAADDEWFEYMDPAILAASTGVGTVPYDLVANSLLTIAFSGGVISIDQSTSLGASVTVEYLIPEPGTLVLGLLGALVLVGYRRR